MQSYEKLLDKAWDSIPEKFKTKERFEIPQVNIFIEGNQTIIKNFLDIAEILRRAPRHLLGFLSRELAAPASIDGNRMIMQRVLKQEPINKKIQIYFQEFVLCHECKRPDTHVSEMKGEKIIQCEACGAWRPLRRI